MCIMVTVPEEVCHRQAASFLPPWGKSHAFFWREWCAYWRDSGKQPRGFGISIIRNYVHVHSGTGIRRFSGYNRSFKSGVLRPA